jgi:hypothetical protein
MVSHNGNLNDIFVENTQAAKIDVMERWGMTNGFGFFIYYIVS